MHSSSSCASDDDVFECSNNMAMSEDVIMTPVDILPLSSVVDVFYNYSTVRLIKKNVFRGSQITMTVFMPCQMCQQC